MSTPKNKGFRLHKAGHDPRAAALVALSRVLFEGVDSQAALDGVLGSVQMVPTDKRLCTEIVYGTLRWYSRIKAFSEKFLAHPEKLPDEMRLALVSAFYEMAFLRVPHHAPVGWAVTHVGNRFGKGLSGVANGTLRSMQRALKDFFAEDQPLHVTYSMPEWIVDLWEKSYGSEQTLHLLKASQQAPPSGLRVNRAKPDWERLRASLLKQEDGEASTDILPVGAAGIAYSGPLSWQARTLAKDGRASRQSAASYQVLESLEPASWPTPVWDCCAGRGGKTLALLEQNIPVALASDPSRQRLGSFLKEYERLGLTALPYPSLLYLSATAAADSLKNPESQKSDTASPQSFGTVVVDAPCSGLGTLARHPEIRLRRTVDDLEQLAGLQKGILQAAWSCLKPGGVLVYLTCTMNPGENQDQIAAFLQAHPGSRLEKEFQTPFDSPLHEFFYGAVVRKDGTI